MLGQSTIGGTTGIQRFLLVVPSLLRWKRPPVLIISTSSPSCTRTGIDSEVRSGARNCRYSTCYSKLRRSRQPRLAVSPLPRLFTASTRRHGISTGRSQRMMMMIVTAISINHHPHCDQLCLRSCLAG
ncbi:hypothetical protein FOQG_19619 [Fusarium oxysporum f. sp. raphani 54005]|uniref:Uncharacterized protein n=1 Tax=Fusarium oxysporum f. sp. raphani 54005 TaxID=1089458 RepID=X0BAT8_FUSOX|nr:hypothetical protein FOQG_19619 [Fusarium oxysporum f. sp. raphani 54005]